ncbi:MAG: hypothetical protein H2043_14185 [Rhizobiales bacterium]|nr:hypothetical protein [Hyphomicrobiales bacterium]
MVSAIRTILPVDRLLSILWSGVTRLPRRQQLPHIDDIPEDLLKDIGIEKRTSSSDPRSDLWRYRRGVMDYLRPGPF